MKNIIFSVLFGATAVHAQHSLSGVVSDPQNRPIEGVSVSIPELRQATVTDAAGGYQFSGLATTTLTLSFSHLVFSTQNIAVDIKNNLIVNVTLEPKITHMDEIIVSTPFHKLQSQNVMKVEHVTMRSLRQSGVPTLIEGLAAIPGVSQIATGTSIGKPVIRGLSGNRVLVYSQGVRLENQQFGDEHGLGLNDSGIESVEVIKGPASLLYGSDALGGVLYFNPEKFAEPKSFKADVSQKWFSNTLGSNISVGLKGSTDKWKFLLRGNHAAHSDYAISGGDRVTNTRYNETDLKSGIGYNSEKFATVLRYNYNKLDLGIPEFGISEQSESKSTQFPKQGVDNHIVSLRNNVFFEKSTLDIDLGYIFNDRREYADSNIAGLHMELNTFNYDIKYHLPKIGRFEIITGVQGMHQQNANFGDEYLIPDATTNDIGVFSTAIFEWKSNALQAGVRFDNRKLMTDVYGTLNTPGYFPELDQSFDSFNASVGYKTTINDNFTIRLNAATGFRAPNLAELTSNGVHEGTNRYEIGNSQLNNERNFQTDLNLEYKAGHFEIYVNCFHNKIGNYIYASPTGASIDDNLVFEYIQDGAQLYGGEAGIHLHPHPFDWLHFDSNFETVTGKKNNGDYLPLIPANNWDNTLRVNFKSGDWLTDTFARINVSSTFAQNNVGAFETRSDSYTLVNAGFGGKFTIGKSLFAISINGNNLFDIEYTAHLSRLKVDGIPNMGRNISFNLGFDI